MTLELSRTARNRLAFACLLIAGILGCQFVVHYLKLSAERRQALAQAQVYAEMLNNEDFAVIAADTSGTVSIWNPAAEKLFGWSKEEMIGNEVFRILPPDLVEMHKKIFAAARADPKYRAHTVRCVAVNRAGEPLDVLLTLRTVPEGHTCKMLVAIDSPALHVKAPEAVRQLMSSTRNVVAPATPAAAPPEVELQ